MTSIRVCAKLVPLLSLLSLWAQEVEEREDEESIEPPYYHHKPSPWRWELYSEIGYNQFLGIPETLRNSLEGLGSVKVNLYLMPMLHIGQAFYIGTGIGLTIRETRFEEPVALFPQADKRLGYRIDSLSSNIRAKSKLQLGYLRIPLEIGLLYRKFNLALYGYGELLTWAKHKRKYRQGSELSRTVEYGNRLFLTEPLQYGVGVRLGYRGLGLFASYNLSFLWEESKGPRQVRPFQAGLYFFDALRLGGKRLHKGRTTAIRL
ncbi:MAG: hypothetical protein RMJ66_01005 [Bacteroidia bacterium]|nr:hypothetical protein [Bacteroidia bacterium]MDW8133622.1 hypothetical protein [Bacteroidia bacterium]